MQIAGLQRTSTIDFPGRLAAVVFCAGCNYRCVYCHNKALLDDPPLLDESEVFDFLKRRAGLLEGVVFSGGEATLQDDLAACLERTRALGYAVKLDTNGSRPDVVGALLDKSLVDFVAVDLKAPPARYPQICAAAADGVTETVALLRDSGCDFELRTTVFPGLSRDELAGMATLVPGDTPWALQLYRRVEGDESFTGGAAPPTPARLEELAGFLRDFGKNAFAR